MLGILVLLIALGIWPTRRLGGEDAIPAMLAGCAISLLGSLAGSLLVRGVPRLASGAAVSVVMGSLALRLLVVLILAATLAVSGWLAPAPLLLWVAISHAALLVADTRYALKLLVRTESSEDR